MLQKHKLVLAFYVDISPFSGEIGDVLHLPLINYYNFFYGMKSEIPEVTVH